MIRIAHITPTLPPVINGVGDFSHLLAKNIEGEKSTENLFYVVRLSPQHQNQSSIIQIDQVNLFEQLIASHPDIIILQYANYGYHVKGLPFYLVNALKKYKKASSCKVFVFFHELYSSSTSLFKLSFYTNRLQKEVVKGLYKLADKTFTNCSLYETLLYRLMPARPFKNTCTGIYSNISEEWFSREEKFDDELVVFGSLDRRNAVYANPRFPFLMELLGVQLVYDIGPGSPKFEHKNIDFIEKGSLRAEEAAVYFNRSRFGLIDYPPTLLGKSSIFSSYCAFGMIPINMYSTEDPEYDGLKEGKNYFHLHSSLSSDRYSYITQEVIAWYSKRNQKAVAQTILQHF